MPQRCTLGCKNTDVPLHVFPNPNKFPDRFKTWVNLVGGKLETQSDYEFYKQQRLCDIHFTICQKNRFKRLNALAVPSLHLPEVSGTLPLETTVDEQPTATQTTATQPTATQTTATQPTATQTTAIQLTATQTTATQPTISQSTATEPTDVLGEINSGAACPLLAEHSYSAITKDKVKRATIVASGMSLHTRWNVRPYQKKIKYLQTEISVLRKRVQLYKGRLGNAQKLSQNVILLFKQVIQHMTKLVQLFVHNYAATSQK